jgi:hypothetical protein
MSAGCPTVSIALRIVFSIVRHCSWHRGFSLAVATPCIVIPAAFPIADRLYFGLQPSVPVGEEVKRSRAPYAIALR